MDRGRIKLSQEPPIHCELLGGGGAEAICKCVTGDGTWVSGSCG